MKKHLFFLLFGFGSFIYAQEFPGLKGDYLGQTPPGDTPVVFARGIVSTDDIEHSAPSFSPDGNEVFWWSIRVDNGLRFSKTMRRVGGKWTAPEIMSDDNMPILSPDGKRLYYSSKKEGEDLYYVEKQGNRWREPKFVGLITRFPEVRFAYYYPSIARNGTLYFMGYLEGDKLNCAIYRAELVNGEYAKPELLPQGIDTLTGKRSWSPFIAPDESYLIFKSGSPDKRGLCICFRQPDGSWMDPVSLGEQINSKGDEFFSAVSPDGNYLFFTRGTPGYYHDVYWVSAGIIGRLKAKAIQEGRLKQRNEKEEIHEAVDAGDLNKVRALIEADPTLLESKDDNGATPLIRACVNRLTFRRQSEVAKFLIEKGANVNIMDNSSTTPLIGACVGFGPDFELIKLLIAKGADVNVMGTNGITPLHWAAFYGDLKVAKFLLDHGAEVNIYDKYRGTIGPSSISGTVLQVAINAGSKNVEMAKFIIESGAKLNRRDVQGNTELLLAALQGLADPARLLVEHGADIDAVNEFNRTALYYAAKHGYRSVAEVLIAAGAKKSTIVETNYGKAQQLTETLKDGEAYIWSLGGHSYAVKTKGNFLVFTISNKINELPEAGLANGYLNPNELAGQKITMFLNHRSYFQMGGKDFGQLAKLVPGINLVSGFKPDFSKEKNPDIPAYHLAAPNESFSVDGIKVHTIPATASGMGYLVEADGVKVFFAGLHVSDNEAANVAKYRKEIDFLKPFGPIDIVFLTVHSHSNSIEAEYEPYLYLIDQLAPKAIYLFGANSGTREQYLKCAEVLRVRHIPVLYPEVGAGERYHYLRDRKKK